MSSLPVKIALTSGDQDGIGPEVLAKALLQLGPNKNVQYVLWRSSTFPQEFLNSIDTLGFRRKTFATFGEAKTTSATGIVDLIDICSDQSPPFWVREAAENCLAGNIDALATAPLSKTLIQKCGMDSVGHTDIFKKLCGLQDVFMGFVGSKFNVVLATDHLPLVEVSHRLTPQLLFSAIEAADSLRRLLKLEGRPIALVGLNPHAGEDGLLGQEELGIFKEALNRGLKTGLSVVGPLVPDAAFSQENWEKYSVFVSPYHDQGLIPFKLIHGRDDGIHLSLGLPFIRTSVDHGTAKDIFGLNRANSKSMELAIRKAIELATEK